MSDTETNGTAPDEQQSPTKRAETVRILMQAAAASLKEASMQPDPDGLLAGFNDLTPAVQGWVATRGLAQLERQHAAFVRQAEKNAEEFTQVMTDARAFLLDFMDNPEVTVEP